MKRVFAILLMGVTMMSVTSCFGSGTVGDVLDKIKNLLKGDGELVEEVVEEVAYESVEAPVYEDRVYSNSYDGYTNVRQSASAKAAVLGKLRNGNEYVNVIGEQGNWYEVEYYDLIGYVHKDYVSRNPSQPVTVDVDANWLEGAWIHEDSRSMYYEYIHIFNNGKFAREDSTDILGYGKWKLEGNEIVLTISHVTEWGKGSVNRGDVYRYEIKKSARKVGPHTKCKFANGDCYYEEYNKSLFNELKKEAKKYVK